MGSRNEMQRNGFSPVFLTYSFHLNQLFHQWPTLTVTHRLWPTVGGWEKYGLTVQIKYPLTTNDSFIG